MRGSIHLLTADLRVFPRHSIPSWLYTYYRVFSTTASKHCMDQWRRVRFQVGSEGRLLPPSAKPSQRCIKVHHQRCVTFFYVSRKVRPWSLVPADFFWHNPAFEHPSSILAWCKQLWAESGLRVALAEFSARSVRSLIRYDLYKPFQGLLDSPVYATARKYRRIICKQEWRIIRMQTGVTYLYTSRYILFLFRTYVFRTPSNITASTKAGMEKASLDQ